MLQLSFYKHCCELKAPISQQIKISTKLIHITKYVSFTPTFTLCRSIGFMMVPWKNSTVVKCLLKRPSSSRSGGFLHILSYQDV